MKKTKQIIAWLLIMVMVIAMPQLVLAEGEESVSVLMSVQADGAFLVPPQYVQVTDGLAESYGYTVAETDHNGLAIEDATFFDALVALHEKAYGEDFTVETATTYLDISGGYLLTAFGRPANSTGYFVNAEMSADENGWGYTADATRIYDNDVIELWFYMDIVYWTDCYTAFDSFKKNAKLGEETTFTLYKNTYNEFWVAELKEVDGTDENNYVTINTVLEDGSISEAITDVNIDENGQFVLTFDEVGTYIITAQGILDGYAPIVAPFCIVTVTEEGGENPPSQGGEEGGDDIPETPVDIFNDLPYSVVDYLCIGSQNTNGLYGTNPEETLTKNLKSLGNFGGYITYYYETPITNNPNNKYGLDFYVFGNNFADGGTSGEPGQVYVSEDGINWYALAGSEHYDNAIWDYTIIYEKGEDGLAYWTDSLGNAMQNQATPWPNDLEDNYSYTGIVLNSSNGDIYGDGTAGTYSSEIQFGYVDYYLNDYTKEVNPYVENPSKSNGFDLLWAVDKDGIPVDVADKEFHYVKIATASNIWAGAFGEKSTEVTFMSKTTPQQEAVGVTEAPTSIVISDGATEKRVDLTEDKYVYEVDLDEMKYVSIKVNGSADDNIYINNIRVTDDTYAEGFKVTKGGKLVRVIVQNGEKEPLVYMLKLTSEATESDEIIEGINVNVSGSVRKATTKNGVTYKLSVGNRVSSVGIIPVIAPEIEYTINGETPAENYQIETGENEFEISALDETVTLVITKEASSGGSGSSAENISVKFTLYGDDKHGTRETHTYKSDKRDLPVWIEKTTVTVPSGSYVIDVFEKALEEAGIDWENSGGNYISEINGLGEQDNGTLSGWMYLLNGSSPSVGVAEQKVKSGDNIIFFFTDDYTKEKGSENFGGGSSGGSVVTKKEDEKTTEPPIEEIKPETSLDFTDVKADEWYYDAVVFAAENGLFNGVSENLFAPDENMTRAMLATVIYRLAGQPETEYSNLFCDVTNDSYYKKAVEWGYKTGILTGVSENLFAPDENITREQLITIMFRYEKMFGNVTEIKNELVFDDADVLSDWAVEATNWGVANGIVNGKSKTEFAPLDNATRAEVATILMRYINR